MLREAPLASLLIVACAITPMKDDDPAPTTAAVERCGTQLAILLQGEGIGSEPDRLAFAVVDGSPAAGRGAARGARARTRA